jgi:hypothetical protein
MSQRVSDLLAELLQEETGDIEASQTPIAELDPLLARGG